MRALPTPLTHRLYTDVARAHTHNNRPYAITSTLTIYCQDGVGLNIPHLFVLRYPKLAEICSPDEDRGGYKITLTGYPEATAHVLAHFLCADAYQCLRPEAASPSQALAQELSTSLQVYTMSQVYEVEPLENLAKEEVKRLGEKMDVQKTLTTVLAALNSRNTVDAWLQGYLKSLIAELMEDPPEAPIGEGAHDPSKPMPLTNVLLNSMIELFRERTNTQRANSPTFVSFPNDNATVAETIAQTFVSFPASDAEALQSRAGRVTSPTFVTCAEDDGEAEVDKTTSVSASAGVTSEANGHSESAQSVSFGLDRSLYESEIAERKREKNHKRNQRRKERKLVERQAGQGSAAEETSYSATGTDLWSDRVETESLQELMEVHSKYGITS